MEQPRGQREAGHRAAGKVAEAPPNHRELRKTTIHNPAGGRGESQEDQPTPRTKPEERTGRAPRENQKSWTERANRKITSQELRDTNRYATRMMARDNTSYDGIKDRHRSQQVTAPRGEGAGARKNREREIWAEENEKKDRKPGAPDRSKQKAKIPLGRKPQTACKAHGQHAQGRPDHRQKPRDRESGPQI